MQKILQIFLAIDGCGLAFFSTDLGHFFGSNIGNEFGVMLRAKGPHKPETAYDIVRIHPHDIRRPDIVGNTKAPLLRCFPIISKLKSGDIKATVQYMNNQTFSNLQFRPLLQNSFHSIHIDLRNTSGEKIAFLSVGITRFVLMFKKRPTFISNLKDVTRWLLQDK